MFLFLDFLLCNLKSYTNIINLCLTSTMSKCHIKHYYLCHKPMILPFPRCKLSRRSTDSWDKFTDHLLSRPLFRAQSNFRLLLCVLMDFLKAEKSFYADSTIVPDPKYNIFIHSNLVQYWFGKGCGMEHDSYYWDSDDSYDTYNYSYASSYIYNIPFEFTLRSKSCSNVLRGIVYSEHDYLAHKSQPDYFESAFFGPYREEFHVVHTLNRTYIIVFISKYKDQDVLRNRFNLQLHDDRDRDRDTDKDLADCDEAFNQRFRRFKKK